jgi:hypothetical protein
MIISVAQRRRFLHVQQPTPAAVCSTKAGVLLKSKRWRGRAGAGSCNNDCCRLAGCVGGWMLPQSLRPLFICTAASVASLCVSWIGCICCCCPACVHHLAGRHPIMQGGCGQHPGGCIAWCWPAPWSPCCLAVRQHFLELQAVIRLAALLASRLPILVACWLAVRTQAARIGWAQL